MSVMAACERGLFAALAAACVVLWLVGLLLIGIGAGVSWAGHTLVDWVMSFGEDFS